MVNNNVLCYHATQQEANNVNFQDLNTSKKVYDVEPISLRKSETVPLLCPTPVLLNRITSQFSAMVLMSKGLIRSIALWK